MLQYKPGALRNGAPFANWDLLKVLLDIKAEYLKRAGGDKEFVQLLLLIEMHSLDAVAACELAIESGTSRLSVITNMLHRLTEPETSKPLSITDAPVLQTPPATNPGRYDQQTILGWRTHDEREKRFIRLFKAKTYWKGCFERAH